jgi:hypothetical protein
MSDQANEESPPKNASIALPATLRSIQPLYNKATSYRVAIQNEETLSIDQLAHALVNVESSLEIIKELNSFDHKDGSFTSNDYEESQRVLQVIAEFKTLSRNIQEQISSQPDFDWDRFKSLYYQEKEDIRVNIITSMAVYYRDRGEKEYQNTRNTVPSKQKAGLFFHSAAIFFHNLILQYHESRKTQMTDSSAANDEEDNGYYQKLMNNFNKCREKMKLCSENLQQNLINEHFLFPKAIPIPIPSSPHSSSSTDSKPGDSFVSSTLNSMLFANYEICNDGKVVGEGGYGTVFVVKHKYTNVQFACKKISTLNMDFKKLGRLHREIAILKQVDHPNIVKLQEVFYDSECVYLLMELCKGKLVSPALVMVMLTS